MGSPDTQNVNISLACVGWGRVLTAPPMSWLKGRLVAEDDGGAGEEELALSLLPVAGMEPW